MNIGQCIVVFVIVWWLVLFMVLPWCIKQEKIHGEGHDHGAPKKSNIKVKMVLTTLIAVVLTGGYVFLFAQGYLGFLRVRE